MGGCDLESLEYGCHKVSAGGRECYMFRDMRRYGRDPNIVRRAKPATFTAPLRWKDPRRIFTCSWSDFFIEEADAWRHDAFDIIRAAPRHTYQILTKRIERVIPFNFPNVWLGVSVEDRKAKGRIDQLRELHGMALRFLSIEPLIEDIGELDLRGIGWVIVGGESASDCHARGFDIEWARSIVGQCKASGVPCFVKQLGSRPTIAIRDNKGGDWAEWPADLRVREFPTEELA